MLDQKITNHEKKLIVYVVLFILVFFSLRRLFSYNYNELGYNEQILSKIGHISTQIKPVKTSNNVRSRAVRYNRVWLYFNCELYLTSPNFKWFFFVERHRRFFFRCSTRAWWLELTSNFLALGQKHSSLLRCRAFFRKRLICGN